MSGINSITLKAARVNRGLSQCEAAKMIGVSEFTLINFEAGRTFPTVPIIKKIEAVYGVPYHQINF
ncbi:helix-turn-helix transcriptional regulator [Megasphaera vaginalis (ex Srinivasan et al. 2021)]|uniref:helix-turn-helix transcriptional regulator n=1 Tax=Megasphaera vaginalis (ex Srinivasan et al. 2021) TaxID=1111454 RepID=UPI00056A4CD7|nr:helix-turn-helix transcriptional regulator [Megasphaera vaginalis (ex Srinivasan et al. 2021)]